MYFYKFFIIKTLWKYSKAKSLVLIQHYAYSLSHAAVRLTLAEEQLVLKLLFCASTRMTGLGLSQGAYSLENPQHALLLFVVAHGKAEKCC